MPLSRQTSRIVWPSRPSTTRPSTSIRMRGVDCGRCGDCVSSRRSASASGGGRRGVGARDEVGHGRPYVAAPAATAIGWQTPAGQELRRRWSSSSDRKYRIPLVSGRVVSRSWSHSADSHDVGGQVGEQCQVGRPWTAVDDPVRDLHQPPRADPAGDRLAAGLRSAEAGQQAGQVDDAGTVIGDDDRTRADVRAGGAERLELIGRVEELGWQQAARRAADEDGLDRATPVGVAAEGDDVAQRRAHRHLGDAVPVEAADVDEDRAGTRPAADGGEGLGPVDDDPGHRGQRLDVLDDGRHVEQAALGGMRRALLRLAAATLERLEQDRLLAEHVGALDRPHRDLDVVAGAEDVRPEEPAVARPHRWRPRACGPPRDRRRGPPARLRGRRWRRRRWPGPRARPKGSWPAGPIGERPGVRAVAVGHHVLAGRLHRGGGPPLVAGRVAGPAPATEPRGGDHADRARRPEVADHPLQAGERSRGNGGVEIGGRIGRSGVGAAAGRAEKDRRPVGRRPEHGGHRFSSPSAASAGPWTGGPRRRSVGAVLPPGSPGSRRRPAGADTAADLGRVRWRLEPEVPVVRSPSRR